MILLIEQKGNNAMATSLEVGDRVSYHRRNRNGKPVGKPVLGFVDHASHTAVYIREMHNHETHNREIRLNARHSEEAMGRKGRPAPFGTKGNIIAASRDRVKKRKG